MSRVKDPELMRALKPLWREHGCGVCGRTVTDEVPAGMDIELAHFERRSKLGPDEAANIIGLCGELTECKAHARFDRYTLTIKRNESGGFVWMDTSPGGHVWQPISMPPEVQAMIDEAEPGGWNVSHETVVDEPVAAVVSDEPPPVGDPALTSTAPSDKHTGDLVPAAALSPADSVAGQRYAQIGLLLRRSRQDSLVAALNLHQAYQNQEWEQLGISWSDYYGGLSLEKSTVSKMLRVGQVFNGAWLTLPEADQAELSVERLYLAARLADRDQLTPSAALAEAVANPTHQLVSQLKGDEPTDRCQHHVCPDCGGSVWHNRKGAAA